MTEKVLSLYYRLKDASDNYYVSDLAAIEHGKIMAELRSLGYNPLRYPWEDEDD